MEGGAVDHIVKIVYPISSGEIIRDQSPALFRLKTALLIAMTVTDKPPVQGEMLRMGHDRWGPIEAVQFTPPEDGKAGGYCVVVLRADQFMNREADFQGWIAELVEKGFGQETPMVKNTYRLVETDGQFEIQSKVE